jgi:hypothetical protein
MPTTQPTTNNGFPFPTAANNGSDFATGVQEFGTAVDTMWDHGTISNRPTSGTYVGQVYYGTDTLTWYRWNGSAWQSRVVVSTSGTGQLSVQTFTLPTGAYEVYLRSVGPNIDHTILATIAIGGASTQPVYNLILSSPYDENAGSQIGFPAGGYNQQSNNGNDPGFAPADNGNQVALSTASTVTSWTYSIRQIGPA